MFWVHKRNISLRDILLHTENICFDSGRHFFNTPKTNVLIQGDVSFTHPKHMFWFREMFLLRTQNICFDSGRHFFYALKTYVLIQDVSFMHPKLRLIPGDVSFTHPKHMFDRKKLKIIIVLGYIFLCLPPYNLNIRYLGIKSPVPKTSD